MRKKILFLFLLCFSFLYAQESSPSREKREVEMRKRDLKSIGVAMGVTVPQGNLDLDQDMFGAAATVDSSGDFASGWSFQLVFEYGLDHYLLAGIGIGARIDFSTIESEFDITAFAGNNKLYGQDGDFLGINTLGFLPTVNVHFFPLLDALFDINLPTSWDIYFYVGVKFNYNFYKEQDLDVKGLDSFHIGFEIGGGIEVFLSDKISARLEGSYFDNSTDLEIVIANQRVFSGSMDWQVFKLSMGLNYYF